MEKRCGKCIYCIKENNILYCKESPPQNNTVVLPRNGIQAGSGPALEIRTVSSWPSVKENSSACGKYEEMSL